MTTATLSRSDALRGEAKGLAEKAQAFIDAAKADGDRDLTPQEQAKAELLLEQATEKRTEAEEVEKAQKSEAQKNLVGDLMEFGKSVEPVGKPANVGEKADGKNGSAYKVVTDLSLTPGQSLAIDPNFKKWRGHVRGLPAEARPPVGSFTAGKASNALAAMGAKGVDPVTKALLHYDGEDGLGHVVQNARRAPIEKPRTQFDNFMSKFDVLEFDTKTIEWPVFSRIDSNMKKIAEATSGYPSPGPEAAKKPEAGELTCEIVQQTICQVASHIPMTRCLLDSWAGIEQFVDSRMLDDMRRKIARQMITGNMANGDAIQGFLNRPGISTAEPEAGASIADAILEAQCCVEEGGAGSGAENDLEFEADCILLNPRDIKALKGLKDLRCCEFNYYNPVTGQMASSVHGLDIVKTRYVPVGTGVVLDSRFSHIGTFGNVGVHMTDSHADEFVYNILRKLYEFYATLVVDCEESICKVDLGTVKAEG